MSIAVVMPQLGLTMEQGTVSAWLKKTGDTVSKDEPLFSVSTDKVEMDVESTVGGLLGEILVGPGETVRVGTVVAYIVGADENVAPQANPASGNSSKEKSLARTPPLANSPRTVIESAQENLPGRQRPASPRAKRLAKESNIDLSSVNGSGPNGQIKEDDVRRAQTPRERNTQVADGRRQLIAERLTLSIQTIPTFSVAVEVNAQNLLGLQRILQETIAGSVKLTITDLLLAIFARALKSSPAMNATWENNTVVKRTSVDIGLAVATAKGVVAPIIRNADALQPQAIAAGRAALVEKARADRLSLSELEGGVATLSNLGMYRVDQFEALISPGQSSILAVGQIRKRPWAEDAVTVKSTVKLNLTVDHRVADGAAAAVFLERIAELIENPHNLSRKADTPSGDLAARRSNA